MVSVKQAREFAMANALAVLKRDPLPYGRRRQPESRRIPTVAEAFEKVIEIRRPTWSGRKMEHDWRASFERYVLPSIGNRKVDAVDTAAVLDVLTPIWHTKRPAARSVRSRLSVLMEWSRAHGFRTDNPCDKRIDGALSSNGHKTTHREALDHANVPVAHRAVADVQGGQRGAALGLMFIMLTGARRDEARLARWDEIDFATATWTIRSERVKTRVEHRVPLSAAAIGILREAQTLGGECVFPGARADHVGESGFGWLIRKVGVASSVHGFRASFRSWAAEAGYPRELGEAALAHADTKVARSYQRSDMLDRRRAMMAAWSRHVTAERGQVVAMRASSSGTSS